MAIKISRFEQNWKISLDEKWRLPDEEQFKGTTKFLEKNNIKYSVEYPAKPHSVVKDIVIRESKVLSSEKKMEKLMLELIKHKSSFGIVFN